MNRIVLTALFLFIASSAFAQSEKWQRDIYQILTEIQDEQRAILRKVETLEEKQAHITDALQELKKNQKSYVNPKWTP